MDLGLTECDCSGERGSSQNCLSKSVKLLRIMRGGEDYNLSPEVDIFPSLLLMRDRKREAADFGR